MTIKLTSDQIVERLRTFLESWDEEDLAAIVGELNQETTEYCGGYAYSHLFFLNPDKHDGHQFLLLEGIYNSNDDGGNEPQWSEFRTKSELAEEVLNQYVSNIDAVEEANAIEYWKDRGATLVMKLLEFESQFEPLDCE